LGYLARALQLAERLPDPVRATMQAELLLQRASVRRSVGDIAGAAEDLKALIAGARATADRRHEIQGLVDLSRALIWIDRGRCLACARQAVDASRTLDDAVIAAMARANYAGWSLLGGHWSRDHVEALEQGLVVARRSNDPHLLNSRLTLHALVANVRSEYRAAQALAVESTALAESLGDGYQFAMSEFSLGWALVHLGCFGEARRLLEQSLLLWRKNQNAHAIAIRSLLLALLSTEAMDFADALRWCDEARAQNAGLNQVSLLGERIVGGRAYAGTGQFAEALACFAEVIRRVEEEAIPADTYWFPLLYLATGECRLARGELSEARHEGRRLCELTEKAPERTYLAHGHRLLAEIAVAEGALGEAGS